MIATVEEELDRLIISLDAYLLGKSASQEVTVQYPSSWWQMFKYQYLPNWFTNVFPIQWHKVPIQKTHYAVCPHLAYDKMEKHVRFPVLSQRAFLKGEDL
jgi:hypothetical protein